MTIPTTLMATSADGTSIAYEVTGSGPGLVLVPGAFASAGDLRELASALAGHHRVATLNRRGRSGSGPQGPHYSLEREVDDVLAVAAAEGARLLVGHSFGGLVCLEAMRGTPGGFTGAALYEPGAMLDTDPEPILAAIERAREQLKKGRPVAGFVTLIRAINPETTGRVPRATLRMILPLVMRGGELRRKAALLDTALAEHEAAAMIGATAERYLGVDSPVLFLAGKEIRTTGAGRAAATLASALTHAELQHYADLDHFGPEKAPARIAADIVGFFARHPAAPQGTSAEEVGRGAAG
jgi:pimeloyl-ACP methyl ester carboxylesterase